MAGWLPEGLAAALAEFRKLTEPHPWAHAAWLMPLVLLSAWLLGKFFEWVRLITLPAWWTAAHYTSFRVCGLAID